MGGKWDWYPNDCCCCKFPVWAAVVMIGVIEFAMAMEYDAFAMPMAPWLWFNTILFALLFIPGLFYSWGYRRCLWAVYGLSYWVFFGMTIWMTVWAAMEEDLGAQLVEQLADTPVDISMGPPGRYAGRKAGYKAIFLMFIRDQDWPENVTVEQQYEAAFWYLNWQMWANVFFRGFFVWGLKKFMWEVMWMKMNPDHPNIGNSHPCGRRWGPAPSKAAGASNDDKEAMPAINMNPVYTGVPVTDTSMSQLITPGAAATGAGPEKPTLVYFNIKVKGEPIRMLLHHAKIPFDEIRVEFKQWPALKPKTSAGALPIWVEPAAAGAPDCSGPIQGGEITIPAGRKFNQ